jgi:hypothetical protein
MKARLAGSGVRPRPPGLEDRAVARLLARGSIAGSPRGPRPGPPPLTPPCAVQLTGDPSHRSLARSPELLVVRAEHVASIGVSAAIPPCRDQVRNGLLEIMAIPAWLRIAQPVDPWGVAMSRRSWATVVGGATLALARPR